MSTSAGLHEQAAFAQAAYANDLFSGIPRDELENQLKEDSAGFVSTQAASFAADFAVVLQYNDTFAEGGLDTGLSLTVFRDRATNALTLGIRGTSPSDPRDLATDLDIFAAGVGFDQIVAMFNWWQRASTGAGSVPQYLFVRTNELYPDALPVQGGYLARTHDASATGELVTALAEAGGKVGVTGHSLGGHLAMAFQALFGARTGGVTVFNAPGFLVNDENTAFFKALGGPSAEVPAGKLSGLTNVIADGVSGDDVSWRAIAGKHSRPGATHVDAPIENQVNTAEPVTVMAFNHSQMVLTDALAVQARLERLQPGLTDAQMSTLLAQAANQEHAGLERMVDALQALLGIDTAPLPTGHDQREALYLALKGIDEHPALAAIADKLTLTPTFDPHAARTDFAALLSLTLGLPFQVRLNDSSPTSPASLALYAQHRTAYEQWLADYNLTAEQRGQGLGHFSDAYLQDRAAMLSLMSTKAARDEADNDVASLVPSLGLSAWTDAHSGRTLLNGSGTLEQRMQVYFGDAMDNGFAGGAHDDRLYGGAGTDTLQGLGGDDLLEGQAGDDRLQGGAGHDTLLGGAGFDTYVLGAGDGIDRLYDADGLGTIEWNGGALPQGLKISDGLWRSADGKVTCTLVADAAANRQDLVLTFGGNRDALVIQDWNESNRSLGISFGGDLPVPETTRNIVGDFVKKVEGQNYVVLDGNYVADGVEHGALDQITGTAVSEAIYGLGGDDAILGREGDDYVDGGEGNDVIQGGLGRDWLIGGAGSDLIYGSSQGYLTNPGRVDFVPPEADFPIVVGRGFNWVRSGELDPEGFNTGYLQFTVNRDDGDGDEGNVILAGAGDDAVLAGQGHDIVVAGDDMDDVQGMAGNDVLVGGEGRDRLAGDGPVGPDEGWVVDAPGASHGVDVLVGNAGDDILIGQGNDDILYGGADDDRLWGDDRDLEETPAEFHGSDLLFGGQGKDRLVGGGGADELHGDGGDDVLWGDSGLAAEGSPGWFAVQFEGDDLLDGGAGDDVLIGEGGQDTLRGGIGSDVLSGGSGDDVLDGGTGPDALWGDDGNDLMLSDGGDWLAGGAGDDTYQVSLHRINPSVIDDGEGQNHLLVGGSLATLQVFSEGGLWFLGRAGEGVVALGANTVIDGLSLDATDDKPSQHVPQAAVAGTPAQALSDDGSPAAGPTLQTIVDRDGGGTGLVRSARWSAEGEITWTRDIDQAQSLTGTAQAEWLEGGAGGDVLRAGAGDDRLDGGMGADALYGGEGGDVLRGGAGNDVLSAGGDGFDTHADVFMFARGDGVDLLEAGASGAAMPQDTIAFDTGITAEDIALVDIGGAGTRQVALQYGAGDSIVFAVGAEHTIAALRFADGSSLTMADLLATMAPAPAPDVPPPDKTMLGGDFGDVMIGTEGDDVIDAGIGDDVLVGGGGNDVLVGGAGFNVYRFAPGSGDDVVVPSAAESALLAFDGAVWQDVTVERDGADAVIRHGQADCVRIHGYFDRPLQGAPWQLTVDGQTIALDELVVDGPVTPVEDLAARREAFLSRQWSQLTSLPLVWNDETGRLETFDSVTSRSVLVSPGDSESLSSADVTTTTQVTRRHVNTPVYGFVDVVAESVEPDPALDDLAQKWQDWIGEGPVPPVLQSVLISQPQEPVRERRIVGWTSQVVETAGPTVLTADATQMLVQGSVGNDTISIAPGMDEFGAFAFRGSVVAGDGDDQIVLSVQWAQRDWFPGTDSRVPSGRMMFDHDRGLGAWVDAGAGDDLVVGTDGHDVLIGGDGSDHLNGGAGADTYVMGFDPGSVDRVADLGAEDPLMLDLEPDYWGVPWSETFGGLLVWQLRPGSDRPNRDVIEFDASVSRDALSFRVVDSDLNEEFRQLQLFHAGQLFLLMDFDATPPSYSGGLGDEPDASLAATPGSMAGVEAFRFADGSTWDRSTLLASLPEAPWNLAPVWNGELLTLAVDEDFAFNLVGVATGFLDPEGQSMTFSATLSDGGPLPSWLSIDALDGELSGIAGNSEVGLWALTVTATDPFGAAVAGQVSLSVVNVNDAPIVGPGDVDNAVATEGQTWVRVVPDDAFVDVDPGDVLTLGATLIDGSALPSWLTFDATGGRFTGTPTMSDIGLLSIELSATDASGATATRPFELTVQGAPGQFIVGTEGDDHLIGLSGDDWLSALGGNDVLDGGAGADTMEGGPGDDVYIVDSVGDSAIEFSGAGIDTVVASLDWILGANVENLTLTGTAGLQGTGNALANRLTGNDGDNVLTGGASPDVLSGGNGNDTLDGGLGADFLAGGAGDDLMVGGRGGDTYYYGAGWGTDTIEENDTTMGVVDRVIFTNATQSQVQFTRQGNDLVAVVLASPGALVVANWYAADRHRVEQFQFADGTVLPGTAINAEAITPATSDRVPDAMRRSTLPGMVAGRLPARLVEALQARRGTIAVVGDGDRLRPALGDASLERQVASLVESMAAWNAGAAVDAPSRLQPLPWRQPSAEQYLP